MLILGHRGVIRPSLAQNSSKGFTIALQEADGFETDACVSSDGEVFLIHEAHYADSAQGVVYSLAEHLAPASAARLGQRRLDEIGAEEARQLRLHDGQPFPLLSTVLDQTGRMPGKVINIELKAYGVVGPVLALVQSALQRRVIAPEAIVISSFNHLVLPQVRQALPSVRVGAIFIGPDMLPARLFPWQKNDPAFYTPLSEKSLRHPALERAQPDWIVMPEDLLTTSTMDLIAAVYPEAQSAAWAFTERGGADAKSLAQRVRRLPQERLAAMIVDDPAAFVEAWRNG